MRTRADIGEVLLTNLELKITPRPFTRPARRSANDATPRRLEYRFLNFEVLVVCAHASIADHSHRSLRNPAQEPWRQLPVIRETGTLNVQQSGS
jgi:hypothetical protein